MDKNISSLPECLSLQPSKNQTFIPDWSLLPEELLRLISTYIENCFDMIHARSVCAPWRSAFPYPSLLLRPRFSLPPLGSKDMSTIEKVQLFLFRVIPVDVAASTSEYFIGGINPDQSADRMELSSPLQCSVKVKLPGSDPILINILDCQILPLGYQYRMLSRDPDDWKTIYKSIAFLPLNKEGGGEDFVVLRNYTTFLLVLRSADMTWMPLKKISDASCSEVVAFRGRFYAVFLNGDVFAIDPYSLEATPLMPSLQLIPNYLVASGNDELFLVEKTFRIEGLANICFSECEVSKLDEETCTWVEVSDLGDRVLFLGLLGNVSCSAKELPYGCGVSGNSILCSYGRDIGHTATYFYKYGPISESVEDDLEFWRFSRENLVRFIETSSVVAIRLERQA